MFGYVLPDKPNLLMKEFSLYRAHYCGVCRAVKRLYGQIPRIALSYDITFFSLFVHDAAGYEVELRQNRCAFHGFQKTAGIALNPLLERVAAVCVMAAYYKADDDARDEGIKKALPKALLKRAYKKAKKALPLLDESFFKHFGRLAGLEKQGCESVDMAADCFAETVRAAGQAVLGEAYYPDAGEFLYHIGKWTYLADALDDLDEDYKKRLYNPFLAAYKNYAGREQFIKDNNADICAAFYGSVNRLAEIFPQLKLTQSQNLLRNIAICGIRKKTEQLLTATGKLKRERV